MRGAAQLKYLIVLLFISSFTKAGNNIRIKEPNSFNCINCSGSLRVLPDNNSEVFKWNKAFNNSGLIFKKRGIKKRGIGGSTPFISNHIIEKTVTYSEFKTHYLNVNFLSFLSYTRFNRGPPCV